MKTVGQKLEAFNVVGVKPGFNRHEENGVSAFEPINEQSFAGKWKIIYFYPKDFTFVCPTEIVGFAKLAPDFADRDAIVLGGSTDNEFSKLGWRRDHKDLASLNHWQFADSTGSLVDQLGVRDAAEGVALRATFVVDPDNVIQHVSRQQPQRRAQPGRDPAHPRRSADRRTVPVQPRGGRNHDLALRARRDPRGAPLRTSLHERNDTMQFIAAIKERMPDYAKDIRLNLDAVIARSSLPAAAAEGAALAAAFAAKSAVLVDAIRVRGTSRTPRTSTPRSPPPR